MHAICIKLFQPLPHPNPTTLLWPSEAPAARAVCPRSPGNGHLFVLPFSIHVMLRERVAYYSSRAHISRSERSGDLVYCHFASQVESYFSLIYGLLRRKNRKTFIRLDLRRRGLHSPPARARYRIFRSRTTLNEGRDGRKQRRHQQNQSPSHLNELGKKICVACPRGFKISNYD